MKYVMKFAEEPATCFEYDSQARAYKHYVLLRLHKDVIKDNFDVYPIQQRVGAQQQVLYAAQKAVTNPDDAVSPLPSLIAEDVTDVKLWKTK